MKKKGRGLSYDEKRDKMLKIFHDTRTVFNYQEIEKLSIKAGIPFPNVKEILNSLKAEDRRRGVLLVIPQQGSTNRNPFSRQFQGKIATSKQQISFYTNEISTLQEAITREQKGREQSEERQELLATLKELQSEESELREQIGRHIRFDPQRVALLRKQNEELKLGVNRETDNLEQIKKYIKKQQPGTRDAEIEQRYGIPADMDYLE